MNFNQYHFDPKLNEELEVQIENLINAQNVLLEYLIKYVLFTNQQQQIQYCECFIELLIKIRFNIEAALNLIPLLKEDYRFKTSVNVLYRSIIDDIINSNYLIKTVIISDSQQNTLYNELSIFHKEYSISTLNAMRSEISFSKRRHFSDIIPEIEDVNDQMSKANPEIFNSDGKPKKNSEIRISTDKSFTELIEQKENSFYSFISETTKLKFIEVKGCITFDNMNSIFKYFSQYQHFSPKMHEWLLTDVGLDLTFYIRCLEELMLLLKELFTILNFIDKDALIKEWDAVSEFFYQ